MASWLHVTPDPAPPAADVAGDDHFVRALARRLARDAHLGDDAAQETWLAALQAAQAPSLFASFGRAWLAVVARNAVLQALRGKARRARREQAAAAARRNGGDAGAPGLEAEVAERLRAAVQGLPPEAREAITLRYFADLLPCAIADRLGVPVETVRTRLKRALARLRAALAR